MNELVITETIYAVPMDHGLASAIEMYRGFRRIVAEGQKPETSFSVVSC